MLPYGQVNHLAYGPGNSKVIGRNTADPARWKRYRGGTAGHLWIANAASSTRQWAEIDLVPGSATYAKVIASGTYTNPAGLAVGVTTLRRVRKPVISRPFPSSSAYQGQGEAGTWIGVTSAWGAAGGVTATH